MRKSPILGLSLAFLMVFVRKTTEVKCHSHIIILRAHATTVIFFVITWLRQCLSGFSTIGDASSHLFHTAHTHRGFRIVNPYPLRNFTDQNTVFMYSSFCLQFSIIYQGQHFSPLACIALFPLQIEISCQHFEISRCHPPDFQLLSGNWEIQKHSHYILQQR